MVIKYLVKRLIAVKLCNLTFGLLTENLEWKLFRESSQKGVEFLHKNAFEVRYNEKRDYQIIMELRKTNRFTVSLGNKILNKITAIDELID